jgi:Na+-translocating ferredoxin:NAD+ oxidoreductase subunit A
MKIIAELLVTALYTIFVQNLVMCSGLGMSEAIRIASKPGTFLKFAFMISGFSTVTSLLCSLIGNYTSLLTSYAIKAAVYGGVLALVYIIVAAFISIVTGDKELLGTLGIAALNTLVFAVPYINDTAAYSLSNSIGSGLGAGFAFVLAAALIGSGAKIIDQNKHIPTFFKGTPAMFLYVGIISLGFVGFTGTTLF